MGVSLGEAVLVRIAPVSVLALTQVQVVGAVAVELFVDAREAHVDLALLHVEVKELVATKQWKGRVVYLGVRGLLGLEELADHLEGMLVVLEGLRQVLEEVLYGG